MKLVDGACYGMLVVSTNLARCKVVLQTTKSNLTFKSTCSSCTKYY